MSSVRGVRTASVAFAALVACLAAAAILTQGAAATGCTVSWNGNAGDGQWTTGSNWSTSSVPGTGDTVCIPSGSGAVTITSGGQTIKSLDAEGSALTISGGNLDLTATSTSSTINALTLNGGSLFVESGVSLTLTGTSTWSTGTIGSPGATTVASGAVLNVDPTAGSAVDLDDTTFTNLGTVNWNSGEFCVTNGSFITNGSSSATGTFNIRADDQTLGGGCNKAGGSPFTNAAMGTVVRSGTAGHSATLADQFVNLGTVHIQSGKLNVAGWGPTGDSGTFQVDTGQTMELSSGDIPFASGAEFTGGGTVLLDGATVTGAVTFNTTTDWSQGSMDNDASGSATIGASGTLNVQAQVDLDSGYTIVNNGTLNLSTGIPFCVTNGSAITNNSRMNLPTTSTLGPGCNKGGPATLTNSATGTVSTTGTGTMFLTAGLNNNGAVEAAGPATLELDGGNTSADEGSFTAAGASAVIRVNGGSRTEGPSASFSGLWKLSNGSVTYNGTTVPNSLQDGGTVLGNMTVPTSGTYEWSGGLMDDGGGGSVTTVAAGGTMTVDPSTNVDLNDNHSIVNLGTLNWDSGQFCATNGGSIQNGSTSAAGTFNVHVDNQTLGAGCNKGGNGPLTNEAMGTIVRAGTASNPTSIAVELINRGTIHAESADLRIIGSNSSSASEEDTGTINIDSGASVELPSGNRYFTSPASVTGAGTLLLDGGAVNGTVALNGATDWSAGTFGSTGTITVGTTGTFTVSGAVDLDSGFGIVNNGTFNWTGASALCLTNGSAITNNGTMSFTSTGTLGPGCNKGGGGGLDNTAKGTITRSGNGTTTTISAPLTNDGTIEVDSGTLASTGTFANWDSTSHTLSGGLLTIFGTFTFAGADIVTNSSGITLDGPSAAITDGTSDGLRDLATNAPAGSLVIRNGRNLTTPGPLANAGAVSIGSASTLTTTGDYTQTGGSTTLRATDANLVAQDGRVNIQDGTLSGLGTVTPNATSAGTTSPGLSPGILTVNGPFTQTSGGSLNVEIGGTSPGGGYDQLNVTGPASLDGTLNISTINSFTPALGSAFKIMTFASHGTTMFPTVHGAVISPTLFYTRQYDAADLTLLTELRIGVTPATISSTEGSAFTGPIATFTDNEDPNTNAASYTATIDWGDGSSPSSGSVTYDAASGRFVVSGSHTYAEQGSYMPSIAVSDSDGAIGSGTATASVSDPAVRATAGSFSSIEGTAPGSQVVATFSDPGGAEATSNYSASVNWGDGTSTQGTITASGTSFTVSGAHTYTEEGHPTITVTLHHTASPDQVVALTGAVADAPLSSHGLALTAITGKPSSGNLATFADADPAAASGDYTATIDWGDHSPSTPGTISGIPGGFAVSGSHTYASSGKFTVTVTITDPGGARTVAISTATVSTTTTNRIRVTGHRAGKQGVQTITVILSGPGVLRGVATARVKQGHRLRTILVARASITVTKPGTARLILQATAAARAILKKQGKLPALLTLTYTPITGSATTQTLNLIFRR